MSDSLRHLPSLMFSSKDLVYREPETETHYQFLLRNYHYERGQLIPNSWVNGMPPIYESK